VEASPARNDLLAGAKVFASNRWVPILAVSGRRIICHGEVIGEPEDNLDAALADAWLGALAHPVATMTAREKAQIMGPKDLSLYMR
jgi:hypothetical protein